MFKRLLVANRGEVAVRIARTCTRLGIEPIAIYSEADGGAPWLGLFADAVCIGPAHPARSYLNQEAILEAAVLTSCQALHPGWGFLAENALFATRARQLGIAFVGPSPRSMRLMGDKALARQTARDLGLPTVPGSDGLIADAGAAREIATQLGYPVLLKATAGGGGRGMRIVRNAAAIETAFIEASGESQAAFGNAGLYVEKFVERGRHIEFQVLGDGHGKAVHLGERECSVQRRHQKLLEEAPSPALSADEREQLGAQIARAMRTLRYAGAGTLEFLRAPNGELYFMEMNTRLQVEHPVTEMITGLDIVEHQLRVACGEPLALRQEDVRWTGHAIEARINAEDPAREFTPAPGKITEFQFPTEVAAGRLRLDTHLAAPAEIPPFYDSLAAKVIAHGADRSEAIAALVTCLQGARVEGVPTTIGKQLEILVHPKFVSGKYDTGLLEEM